MSNSTHLENTWAPSLATVDATSNISSIGSLMRRTPAYRLLAVIAAIAVLGLASAALAHSHRGAKPSDESHCGICMSAHSGTNGLASSSANLHFVPVVSQFALEIIPHAFVSTQPRPARDRAPPNACLFSK